MAEAAEWACAPGDVLLLASDGLSDNVAERDLLELVRGWADGAGADSNGAGADADADAGADAGALALTLVATARARSLDRSVDSPFALAAKDCDIMWGGGRPDDVTVLAVRLRSPPILCPAYVRPCPPALPTATTFSWPPCSTARP